MTPAQDATALAVIRECPFCGFAGAQYTAGTATECAKFSCAGCGLNTRATSQTPEAVREAIQRGCDAVNKELEEQRSTPSASAGPQAGKTTMTEDQIKYLVNRFLGWKLPKDFTPDCGIVFNAPSPNQFNPRTPYGTNLFDAPQADAMVRYLIDGMPSSAGPQAEAVAWAYERATARTNSGKPALWQNELTFGKPDTHEFIRNARPLYAHPQPQQADGRADEIQSSDGSVGASTLTTAEGARPARSQSHASSRVDASARRDDDATGNNLGTGVANGPSEADWHADFQARTRALSADGRGAVIEALDKIEQRLNESGTGEMGLIDTIHAVSRLVQSLRRAISGKAAS